LNRIILHCGVLYLILCVDLAHPQLCCIALHAFILSVVLKLHNKQNFKLSFALISIHLNFIFLTPALTLVYVTLTLALTFAFALTLTLIVRYDRLSLLEDATATSAQNGTGTGTGIGMVGVINGGDRSSAHMKERTSSFVSQSQSQSESHIKSSPNGRALSPSDMEFKYPKSRDAEGVFFGNRGDGIAVKNLTVQPGAHTPLLDTKKNGNGNGSGNGKSNAKGPKGYGSNN
jgi:hypothetical protein